MYPTDDDTPIYNQLACAHVANRVLDSKGGQYWLKREFERLEAWMQHPATRSKYGSKGWDKR